MEIKINKTISKESFLRHVFLELAERKSVPQDIFDAKFGEVIEKEIEFYCRLENVSLFCKAEVGNEKMVYKRYDDYIDAKPTKIVEWNDESKIENRVFAKVYLEPSQEQYRDDLECFCESYESRIRKCEKVIEVPNSFEIKGKNFDEWIQKAFPYFGDMVANCKYSSETTNVEIYHCCVTVYVLKYSYNDKEYFIESGVGDSYLYRVFEKPYLDNEKEINRIEEEFNKKDKIFDNILIIFTIIFFIFLFWGIVGLCAISDKYIRDDIFIIGGFSICFISAIVVVSSIIKGIKIKKEYDKKIDDFKKKKFYSLVSTINKYNLSKLTKSERESLKKQSLWEYDIDFSFDGSAKTDEEILKKIEGVLRLYLYPQPGYYCTLSDIAKSYIDEYEHLKKEIRKIKKTLLKEKRNRK